MLVRFPRMSAGRAEPHIGRLIEQTVQQLDQASLSEADLGSERFAATGARRATLRDLGVIRDELREALERGGYPGQGLPVRQTVDRQLAITLANLAFPVGEMLRSDTWTWLCVNVLPGYVKWRWSKPDGGITGERISGSVVRNALGRLWLRGWIFDQGAGSASRWQLIERLSEDASVAILERTSISSDHRLARAVVKCWLDASRELSHADSEDLLRDGIVKLRMRLSLVEAGVLTDQALHEFVTAQLTRRI